MSRVATRWDIPQILPLLEEFSASSPLPELAEDQNEEWVENLVTQIIVSQGTVWIEEVSNIIVGVLMATRIPSIWNPRVVVLHELAFYIRPPWRSGRRGWRLLTAFNNYAAECGLPTVFSTLNDSEINLEHHGYTPVERVWRRSK